MTLTNDFNTPTAVPGDLHVAVRMSKTSDVQIVRDFYKDFKHEFVEQRDHKILDKYTKGGRIILFTNKADDSLCASSIAISHSLNVKKGPQKNATWTEIGATRIALKGFNLSPFMVGAQIMNEVFQRPPQKFFFADIYKPNKTASGILSQIIGWNFFTPDDDLVDASEERYELDLLDWLQCTTKTLPRQAHLLLKAVDNPVITNKATGQNLHLDTSGLPWLKSKRALLENVARGSLSAIFTDAAANQNIEWAATQLPKRGGANKPKAPTPNP